MPKRARPIATAVTLPHPWLSLNGLAFSVPFRAPLIRTDTSSLCPCAHPLRPSNFTAATPLRLTRLPARRRRSCYPSAPVCTAVTQDFAKKDEVPEPDDPWHLDSAFADPPSTPFSGHLAKSSLQALVSYYRQMCRQQPFIARRLLAAVVAIMLSKIIGLVVPFLFKRVIDLLMVQSTSSLRGAAGKAEVAKSFRVIGAAILFHGLARVLASVSHELRNSVFAKAGQRIGRSITAASFAHILSLEAAFHNSSQTGALTRICDRGTRSVLTIFRGMLFAFLPSMFELLLVCGVLLRNFSRWYAIVTLVTFLAFIGWTLAINDELGKVRAKMNAVDNESSAKLTDSLMNVEAVKSFDNGPFEFSRYDQSLEKYENIAIRNEWLFAFLNMGQGAIFTVGLTANLFLATSGVLAGTLTVGSVVMLATMLQQFWVPLNFLGWQYREVKQSLIDLQNLFEILQREPMIADAHDAKPLQVSGGEIKFDNVYFQYPEPDDSLVFARKDQSKPISLRGEDASNPPQKRKLALENLSFTVPAGKSLALVGSSGSGKSTATRLLYRLYDLSSGKITIDGQDISKATLASLKRAVSIVPQDTALFNDTIAYNIRYGRPSATDEEVIAAAKAASIHDVIMRTPQNYQTLVGERGVRLSGGERQRLSVARAFLKGSSIILEDESTSALDTLTELEVSKALQKLGVDRTRIIVAHRLSTIMNVDHIVVMRFGRKVEEGTFSQLLNIPNGVFKGMWERQQKQDQSSSNPENGAGLEEDYFFADDLNRGSEAPGPGATRSSN